MMVKRKNYFRNPISRQNFANAFAETPNLNLEVRLMHFSEAQELFLFLVRRGKGGLEARMTGLLGADTK